MNNEGASNAMHSEPSPTNTETDLMSVDKMTSREFQTDMKAHIESAFLILKDKVFIKHFEAAIMHNKHLFKGRTVLDINCNLGILSLFAAKAGAARVYAVDDSNVCDYTSLVVKLNNYEDVIEVIKGRIEHIKLPCKEVDIILCNWPGYSLLFQSTAKAVIYARDKWLKKEGGMIFPDAAKLYVAAIDGEELKNERIEWWRDVYGFDMKSLREVAILEPAYQAVHANQVISTAYPIKKLNMYTAKKEDLQIRSQFKIEIERSARMHGVMTYFDVYFTKSHKPLGFRTDPTSPLTNWMQSVFLFDQHVTVTKGNSYFGGIDMFSTCGNEYNLNSMEMGIEIFSGDPTFMHLETEMRWFLKPHSPLITDNIEPQDELEETESNAVAVNSMATEEINNNSDHIEKSKKERKKKQNILSHFVIGSDHKRTKSTK